ncbi:glycine cleavage system aminomethyltransferase GcvT [Candidatus Pelagibacter sp.]|nr:glycine cleavage system aminomethyltransferase GcvT [Candidatus Pelagibacter sp.]|tara:strand:+ start:59 stop:1165 length:1107 start_codon:yes stop_codon:yes gene_type:complete
MNIKKTALNSLHKKYGAKFVPFAGYEMPIQYSGGIIEEHKITRDKSGIFDVSHMGQLFIKGDNLLADDLEKIFPTDLKNAQINQSKYSFLMNEEAGIYDDLIITKVKSGFNIVLNAACKYSDFDLLKKLLANKYEMNLSDELSLIAIQGPESVKILEKIIKGVSGLKFMNGNSYSYLDENIYITRSGYTGEDGFEISITDKKVETFVQKLINEGSKLIGLGARDTLRLEAGLCLYGHDMDINKSPVEANLKWAISKNRIASGGFIGFEKIKYQIEKGVSKVRVGIKPEGRIIAREKTIIFSKDNKNIGEITSGTFGPSVQGPVAMGYIENSFSKIDTKVFLEVRGKKHPASISNLPFYKKSYVKGANK